MPLEKQYISVFEKKDVIPGMEFWLFTKIIKWFVSYMIYITSVNKKLFYRYLEQTVSLFKHTFYQTDSATFSMFSCCALFKDYVFLFSNLNLLSIFNRLGHHWFCTSLIILGNIIIINTDRITSNVLVDSYPNMRMVAW
jgi:hypothetical protein